MYKAKSNKELCAFLFNDFLLLTYTTKQFTSSGPDKLFSNKNNVQLKMYKPVNHTVIDHYQIYLIIDIIFKPKRCWPSPIARAPQWSTGEAARPFQRRAHLPHFTHWPSLYTQNREYQWTVIEPHRKTSEPMHDVEIKECFNKEVYYISYYILGDQIWLIDIGLKWWITVCLLRAKMFVMTNEWKVFF